MNRHKSLVTIIILLVAITVIMVIWAVVINKKHQENERMKNNTVPDILEATSEETVQETVEEQNPLLECKQYMNFGTKSVISKDTDYSEFSSERVPFGMGRKYDENNVPLDLTWYSENHGQFTADYVQPHSKYIFLTFDEGYEYKCTPAILDTLKEKNAKAVFFVTLPYAMENPHLVRRMIDEGHVVGNHTSTHPSGGIQQYSVEEQIKDIDAVTKYIKDNFDYDMYLFRFPEGAFSDQSLAIVQNLGYRSVFWSYAYKDWDTKNQPDEEESLNKAVERLHGGAIYLFHAQSVTNANILGDFIDKAREKGFEFGYYWKMD